MGGTASSPGWASRPTPSVRRKPSNVSTVSMSEDSPRMSRMDRSARSVSQPRGKRDSSVSSAYGGAGGFRGSRESLHSGMTYSARRGSNASMYEGPGSLPGYARRGRGGDYDDGASD